MTNDKHLENDNCALCDLRMSEALTVVSRHRTAAGTVVYARCACGKLSMWLEPVAVVRVPPELRATARASAAGHD